MVAKSSNKKTPKLKKSKTKPQQEDILQAIDAISDESDEEDAGRVIENNAVDDEQWDDEALALRRMISDGMFNDLLKNHDKKNEGADEEMVEEAELNSSDDDDSEEENEGGDTEKIDDGDSSDETEEKVQKKQGQDTRATALVAAMQSSNRSLPFAESFTVVPPTPLPFGVSKKNITAVSVDDEDEEDGTIDVHDDLKREVAFYDTALEAVNLARLECEKVGIPFTRPEDFFAEMIKTDGKF